MTTECQVTLLPGLCYLKVLEPSFAQVTPFANMWQPCKWLLFDLHNFASEKNSRLQKDGEKAPSTLKGLRGYLESSLWVYSTNRSLFWKCGKTDFSKFSVYLPLLFGATQFNRNTKIKEFCKPCFIIKMKKRIFLKWFIFPFFFCSFFF